MASVAISFNNEFLIQLQKIKPSNYKIQLIQRKIDCLALKIIDEFRLFHRTSCFTVVEENSSVFFENNC